MRKYFKVPPKIHVEIHFLGASKSNKNGYPRIIRRGFQGFK